MSQDRQHGMQQQGGGGKNDTKRGIEGMRVRMPLQENLKASFKVILNATADAQATDVKEAAFIKSFQHIGNDIETLVCQGDFEKSKSKFRELTDTIINSKLTFAINLLHEKYNVPSLDISRFLSDLNFANRYLSVSEDIASTFDTMVTDILYDQTIDQGTSVAANKLFKSEGNKQKGKDEAITAVNAVIDFLTKKENTSVYKDEMAKFNEKVTLLKKQMESKEKDSLMDVVNTTIEMTDILLDKEFVSHLTADEGNEVTTYDYLSVEYMLQQLENKFHRHCVNQINKLRVSESENRKDLRDKVNKYEKVLLKVGKVHDANPKISSLVSTAIGMPEKDEKEKDIAQHVHSGDSVHGRDSNKAGGKWGSKKPSKLSKYARKVSAAMMEFADMVDQRCEMAKKLDQQLRSLIKTIDSETQDNVIGSIALFGAWWMHDSLLIAAMEFLMEKSALPIHYICLIFLQISKILDQAFKSRKECGGKQDTEIKRIYKGALVNLFHIVEKIFDFIQKSQNGNEAGIVETLTMPGPSTQASPRQGKSQSGSSGSNSSSIYGTLEDESKANLLSVKADESSTMSVQSQISRVDSDLSNRESLGIQSEIDKNNNNNIVSNSRNDDMDDDTKREECAMVDMSVQAQRSDVDGSDLTNAQNEEDSNENESKYHVQLTEGILKSDLLSLREQVKKIEAGASDLLLTSAPKTLLARKREKSKRKEDFKRFTNHLTRLLTTLLSIENESFDIVEFMEDVSSFISDYQENNEVLKIIDFIEIDSSNRSKVTLDDIVKLFGSLYHLTKKLSDSQWYDEYNNYSTTYDMNTFYDETHTLAYKASLCCNLAYDCKHISSLLFGHFESFQIEMKPFAGENDLSYTFIKYSFELFENEIYDIYNDSYYHFSCVDIPILILQQANRFVGGLYYGKFELSESIHSNIDQARDYSIALIGSLNVFQKRVNMLYQRISKIFLTDEEYVAKYGSLDGILSHKNSFNANLEHLIEHLKMIHFQNDNSKRKKNINRYNNMNANVNSNNASKAKYYCCYPDTTLLKESLKETRSSNGRFRQMNPFETLVKLYGHTDFRGETEYNLSDKKRWSVIDENSEFIDKNLPSSKKYLKEYNDRELWYANKLAQKDIIVDRMIHLNPEYCDGDEARKREIMEQNKRLEYFYILSQLSVLYETLAPIHINIILIKRDDNLKHETKESIKKMKKNQIEKECGKYLQIQTEIIFEKPMGFSPLMDLGYKLENDFMLKYYLPQRMFDTSKVWSFARKAWEKHIVIRNVNSYDILFNSETNEIKIKGLRNGKIRDDMRGYKSNNTMIAEKGQLALFVPDTLQVIVASNNNNDNSEMKDDGNDCDDSDDDDSNTKIQSEYDLLKVIVMQIVHVSKEFIAPFSILPYQLHQQRVLSEIVNILNNDDIIAEKSEKLSKLGKSQIQKLRNYLSNDYCQNIASWPEFDVAKLYLDAILKIMDKCINGGTLPTNVLRKMENVAKKQAEYLENVNLSFLNARSQYNNETKSLKYF